MIFNVLLIAVVAIDVQQTGSFLQKDIDLPEVQHEKEAGGGYLEGSPMFEKQEKLAAEAAKVPPVSTTMVCIMNLTVQYFFIYTALLICQTVNQYSNNGAKNAEAILESAKSSVMFAPMLSIMFLGTRMRALQLSQGMPDEHDLPQPFVKTGMQMASWAVLAQCVFSIAGGIMGMGKEGTGTVEKALAACQSVATLTLYVGFSMVGYGAITMPAPESLWGDSAPGVSPAVACTLNLSVQYFAVYLAILLAKYYSDFANPVGDAKASLDNIKLILRTSESTVSFAPMLCVLFIGARMRALQLDPVAGNPQPWAQNCFYLCTYAVLGQIALVFLVPLALGGKAEQGTMPGPRDATGKETTVEIEGDITFKCEQKLYQSIINICRYTIMLAMYGGFIAVIFSVIVISAPPGETTPPVSSAMKCVMNLTMQYFLVYLALQVLLTVKELSDGETGSTDLLKKCLLTVYTCKNTVMFCPMLCVLFIGLRLRALQITQQKGNPQGWAQEAMFLSSYAVLAQLVLAIVAPDSRLLEKYSKSKGGAGGQSMWLIFAKVCDTLRYVALISLYVGAVTCCIAVFLITPETADGSNGFLTGLPKIPVVTNPIA